MKISHIFLWEADEGKEEVMLKLAGRRRKTRNRTVLVLVGILLGVLPTNMYPAWAASPECEACHTEHRRCLDRFNKAIDEGYAKGKAKCKEYCQLQDCTDADLLECYKRNDKWQTDAINDGMATCHQTAVDCLRRCGAR